MGIECIAVEDESHAGMVNNPPKSGRQGNMGQKITWSLNLGEVRPLAQLGSPRYGTVAFPSAL